MREVVGSFSVMDTWASQNESDHWQSEKLVWNYKTNSGTKLKKSNLTKLSTIKQKKEKN